MLDPSVIKIADELIRVQFKEREDQLHREIVRVQSELSAKGLGISGAVVQLVGDLCARDIELRTLIVWQNIVRVLSHAGVLESQNLSDELKQAVLRYEEDVYTVAHQSLEKTISHVGIGSPQISLAEARDRAFAKVNAEIDLYVLSVTRRAAAQGKSSQPVFNIYSPVGAIQTGPTATANIVQTISPKDKETLLDAVNAIKQGLLGVDALPAHPKQEIIELVNDAEIEISKPNPNGTKLQSILSAVATAIQTVGSLQPAYQALKAALLALGITLP